MTPSKAIRSIQKYYKNFKKPGVSKRILDKSKLIVKFHKPKSAAGAPMVDVEMTVEKDDIMFKEPYKAALRIKDDVCYDNAIECLAGNGYSIREVSVTYGVYEEVNYEPKEQKS